MDETLIALFHRFAGLAFDRQNRFAEFVARKAPGAKRALDVENGVLSYGPKLQFEALLVGVHADHNDSWMWTWANRTIRVSVTNRALGDTIRALAHRVMSPSFAKPAFPLDLVIGPDLTSHAALFFGAILVGELDYDAHLLAKHDGNPALFLIRDERLRAPEKYPLARIRALFPKMIAATPVTDHRAAFTSYVQSYGLATSEEAGRVKVTGGAGELLATFDDSGRLAKLEGANVAMPKPRPAATPNKKPPKVASKTRPVSGKKSATSAKKPVRKR